jgi:hypothetical protein
VTVDAAVRELGLTSIAFDSNSLRVIAEANANAKVAVTKLRKL